MGKVCAAMLCRIIQFFFSLSLSFLYFLWCALHRMTAGEGNPSKPRKICGNKTIRRAVPRKKRKRTTRRSWRVSQSSMDPPEGAALTRAARRARHPRRHSNRRAPIWSRPLRPSSLRPVICSCTSRLFSFSDYRYLHHLFNDVYALIKYNHFKGYGGEPGSSSIVRPDRLLWIPDSSDRSSFHISTNAPGGETHSTAALTLLLTFSLSKIPSLFYLLLTLFSFQPFKKNLYLCPLLISPFSQS